MFNNIDVQFEYYCLIFDFGLIHLNLYLINSCFIHIDARININALSTKSTKQLSL